MQKVSELVDVGDSQIRSSPTRLSSSPTRSLVKGGRSSTCLKTTKEEMTTLEGRVVAGFLVRDFEALEEQHAMRMEGTGLKGGNVLGFYLKRGFFLLLAHFFRLRTVLSARMVENRFYSETAGNRFNPTFQITIFGV